MGKAKRHHVVSKSYLRAWSRSDSDPRVALIDKKELTARPVSIRDVFVMKDLLTFATPDGPSDELETAFGRVESIALPQLHRFIAGERDARSESAIIALIALHWARSYAVVKAHERAFHRAFIDVVEEAETSPGLRDAFQRDHGREPNDGELRQRAVEVAEMWREGQTLFTERVEMYYKKAFEHFGQKHIQRIDLVGPGRVQFVVADAPVVLLGGPSGIQGSAARPCPLMDANSLWFPLAPHVGVSLLEQPEPDQQVDPTGAQVLNTHSWRYAHSRIAGLLDADIDLAIVRSPGTVRWTGRPTR